MAKTVKNIVQSVNGKVLTKREASRYAQDERRKLQRRLASSISKETGEKVSYKEAESVYESMRDKSPKNKQIYKDIQNLKYNRSEKGYTSQISEVAERTERFYPNEQTIARRNRMFQGQINEASRKRKKDEEGEENYNEIYGLNQSDIHSFYAATQFIWGNAEDESNRNELISAYFGTDLETVYKLIMEPELDFEEFGFETIEEFNEWLEDIGIAEIRDIVQDETQDTSRDIDYDRFAVQNIVNRIAIIMN